MLGEKLGEEIGQMTAIRVLPPENGAPVIEASFTANGTLLGEHATDMGTYRAVQRPDGTLRGNGQGVVMTETGATLAWTGGGIGQPTGRGTGVHWRGAVYYQTTSEKHARLNRVPVLFEFDTDETGKTEGRFWEWK